MTSITGWKAPAPARWIPTPYIGDYRSGDADARYRVFLDRRPPWIAGAAAWNVAVDPVGADRFLAGPWTLHFMRDASGRVLGMQLARSALVEFVVRQDGRYGLAARGRIPRNTAC